MKLSQIRRRLTCLPVIAIGVVGISVSAPLPSTYAQLPSPPALQPLHSDDMPDTTLAPDYRPQGETRAFKMAQKKHEKQIRKIRFMYLGNKRDTETRQEGMERLSHFTKPESLDPLVETLEDEQSDVQTWLVDHLLTNVDAEYGQPTVAYLAIFSDDPARREIAMSRLGESGEANARTRFVIEKALRSRNHSIVNAGAIAAGQLKLFEAIPLLITAQAGRAAVEGTGDLAFIAIGTQRYFVSDLQPVVGDNSAGFDPQLSSLFEGTVMRIQDAVVEFKRMPVHNVLMGMAEQDFGQPVDFGFDIPAWRHWYNTEYIPHKLAQLEQQQQQDQLQGQGASASG